MVQAFIFDLDGTLVDTELLWVDAMLGYLADRQAVAQRVELMRIVFGRSWVDIHRDITARFPPVAHVPRQQMGDELRDYYVRLRNDPMSIVIRSSVDMLKRLAQEYPVIVVSGSPHYDVEDAVRLMGAEDSVRFVLGAEDYTPGKPSPAGFLLGAQKLGVDPAACVVFEDSWAGVTAAKAANMMCVALARPSEHQQDVSHADWVVQDLGEFSIAGLVQRVQSRTSCGNVQ